MKAARKPILQKKKTANGNKKPKPSKYARKIKVNASFDEVMGIIVANKKQTR